jgi:hypothetical protein
MRSSVGWNAGGQPRDMAWRANSPGGRRANRGRWLMAPLWQFRWTLADGVW